MAPGAKDPSTGITWTAKPLLPRKASYARTLSLPDDELRVFRSCLRLMCVDQSDVWHGVISWSLFLLLGVFVPSVSHFLLNCTPRRSSYDVQVQLSLTGASALSYVCLSAFVRCYGLRRFLFLDKLVDESERVREGYITQLKRSFHLLSAFVMPCFAGEVAYKAWWYSSGEERVPFTLAGSTAAAAAAACLMELTSWIYRMVLFLFVCVLFRLMCHLQILRLQDFAAVLGDGPGLDPQSDVAAVLADHISIRKQLKTISHRYRSFILSCLVLVSASQLSMLLLTTRPRAVVNLSNSGELVLSSIGLMTGLLICLRSAAKITHKAQAITSQAATWHAYATVKPFDAETDIDRHPHRVEACTSSDESGDEDDEVDQILDVRKITPSSVETISYHKRKALVMYLEHNRAGITLYGFVLDRTWLHALFMIEFSLVMWLLGKTIGIS